METFWWVGLIASAVFFSALVVFAVRLTRGTRTTRTTSEPAPLLGVVLPKNNKEN
jgi:hypothetical protein